MRVMKAAFVRSEQEAPDIWTYYFEPEQPISYTAGQFTEWILDHKNPDSRGIKRWFTISASPSDELISLTTKFSQKSSSYKKALQKMKPGDIIKISDTMGDFVLPKLIQTPLVFVAGGIGITPYHSMLSWLSQTNETRHIKMIHAVKTEEEAIFAKTIEVSGIHRTVVVSEPTDAWGGERGHVSAEMILGIEKPSPDTLIYVSGPEPMVEQLELDLKELGIKPSQLVLDFFPNYLAE